jgi:outer membrane protein insertion porin family
MQVQQKRSRPSEGVWVAYDESVEQIMREDFLRLYNTNFLDNISIETLDYTFSNGVVGKILLYNMEERQRIKIVDGAGSEQMTKDWSKVLEAWRTQNVEIRTDSFLDQAVVRKAAGIIRDMMREKGLQFAEVKPEVKELPGGPKLAHLTFHMNEGPKVKIRRIEFDGNRAASDRALRRRMKGTKQAWFMSFMTGRGTYQEGKFEEDAQLLLDYYRDRGFITARVGDPELRYLEDSGDKETRWVELRVPVVEGNRYRIGDFNVEGNTVIKTEALLPLFDIEQGEYYSQKKIRRGFERAQQVYGAGGYFEFTGYPDARPRDLPDPAEPAPAAGQPPVKPAGPPIADVTLRLQEGKQHFVNRITFVGNTTTRDNVIRRELRLYENGVFDTEALKYSIRRINQLGYFKALEGPGRDVTFEKTPGTDNKVDVSLKVEEQNRNQLTFGAGVSQFEGFFGQLSFQTANFLGRGESLTVSLQGGQRAQNYTLAFTEPFLFDRNITGGLNLFRTEVRYISQFTQKSAGGSLTFGFPVGSGFTRMFTNYSYQRVRVTEINEAYNNPILLARNPFLRDSLLIGANGERIISQITPSIVYNTVDQPIFPTTGRRFTISADLAGLGGNTNFYSPQVEGVWIIRQNTRMSLAMRGQAQYINTFRGTKELPIFEKLFLGGEYSVRGFDIRSIGPSDPETGLVLGGNKSLLFNVEQNINIAGPVRLILFYDAGQVRNEGESFGWTEQVEEPVPADGPLLFDPFATIGLIDPNAAPAPTVLRRRPAFKTSTGAEIRFFMPVLNVPFRLIFAYNPQREGVLDNSLQPQKAFQFRFAVGTTF